MSRLRACAHVIVLAVGALVVLSGCGSSIPQPVGKPDPGHRLMQQIAPVLGAAPSAAHVTFRQKTEPIWDSCDGQASTYGWDPVTVTLEFRGGGSRGAIVSQTRVAMRR